MNGTNKLVTVWSFTGPLEAHIAKGRLNAEGLRAWIAHEHHVWADWPYSQALGGVKIQVYSSDAEVAVDILSAHVNGEYETALSSETEVERNLACPSCGSGAIKRQHTASLLILAFITFGLMDVIFPLRKNRCTCLRCKNRWTNYL